MIKFDLYTAGLYPMVFGVLVSLIFVALLVWYVNKKISGHLSQKEWLTRFVALMLTCFLGLFMVDKMVSFPFGEFVQLFRTVQNSMPDNNV